jgi:surfactin synthase thioesterase subunit
MKRTEAHRYLPFLAHAKPAARIRLFCLPYAGAGASVYRYWPAAFPPSVDVQPVQLPGREGLMGLLAIDNATELARLLGEVIAGACDLPVALFGHSMGALLAGETTARLERVGGPVPRLLVVSGREAGSDPQEGPTAYDDEQLAGFLVAQGIGTEILEEPELRDLMLDVLRNDFTLCASYRPTYDRLSVPILALGGSEEGPPERFATWSDRTVARCHVEILPGGHFALHDNVAMIAGLITEQLADISLVDFNARKQARP